MTMIDMFMQPINFWRHYRSVRRQLRAISITPSMVGSFRQFEPAR